MSTVNKIDIDGVQWEIEDHYVRDNLATLEQGLAARLENIFTGDIDNSKFSIPSNGTEVTANYTGFFYTIIAKSPNNSSAVSIYEDSDKIISTDIATSDSRYTPITLLIRKGRKYHLDKYADANAKLLRPYFIPFNFG